MNSWQMEKVDSVIWSVSRESIHRRRQTCLGGVPRFLPARAVAFTVQAGEASSIDVHFVGVERENALRIHFQTHHPSLALARVVRFFHDEVANAVHNGLAFVDVNVLRHMRMPTQHRISARIDGQSCQLPLACIRHPFIFPTPMHQRDHHIGPMAQDFHAAFNVGDNDVTISAVDPAGVALAAIAVCRPQGRGWPFVVAILLVWRHSRSVRHWAVAAGLVAAALALLSAKQHADGGIDHGPVFFHVG